MSIYEPAGIRLDRIGRESNKCWKQQMKKQKKSVVKVQPRPVPPGGCRVCMEGGRHDFLELVGATNATTSTNTEISADVFTRTRDPLRPSNKSATTI